MDMGWNWVARATKIAGLGSVAITLAMAVAGAAHAGIADTKHNLGKFGPGVNKFDGTEEICVFCHTPHGADTGAAVPLWNRKLDATPATTYVTYDQLKTSTLDGQVLAVGSVSLACLSCHDGQTAMSTVINKPGSGGYDPAGSGMTGSWSGLNQTNGTLAVKDQITYIGTDLKNDHPVGVQYAGGGYSVDTPAPAAGNDADFKAAQNGTLNGTRVWWVDTGTTGLTTRQKTDMILYTRTGKAGKDEPFVECASCHDPHVSENPTFLRIKNDNSAVCLACHTK
jgi:predicted CXXCH cytochrome family protein